MCTDILNRHALRTALLFFFTEYPAHPPHKGMVPAELLKIRAAAFIDRHRRPHDPAIGVVENEPFRRRRLDRFFRLVEQERIDPVLILFPLANLLHCRRHAPHLVPEETFRFHFETGKIGFLAHTDGKDISIRIFIPDTGKVREVVVPEKVLCGIFHLRFVHRAGKIIAVRA